MLKPKEKIAIILFLLLLFPILPFCSRSPEKRLEVIVRGHQKEYVLMVKRDAGWGTVRALARIEEKLRRSNELDAFGDIDRIQHPELLAYLCAMQIRSDDAATLDSLSHYTYIKDMVGTERWEKVSWPADMVEDTPDIVFPFLVIGYLGANGADVLLKDLQSNVESGDIPLIRCDILGLCAAGEYALVKAAELVQDGNKSENYRLKLIDVMRLTSGLKTPQMATPYRAGDDARARASDVLFSLYTTESGEISTVAAQALAHGNFPIDAEKVIDFLAEAEAPGKITDGVYILTGHLPLANISNVTKLAEPFGRWLSNDETYTAAIWFYQIFPGRGKDVDTFIMPTYRALLERATGHWNELYRIEALRFLAEKLNIKKQEMWNKGDLDKVAAILATDESEEVRGYCMAILKAHGRE